MVIGGGAKSLNSYTKHGLNHPHQMARFTQTQATGTLFICQSTRPRLHPAGEEEDDSEDEDGDLAGVRVPAARAPFFFLELW